MFKLSVPAVLMCKSSRVGSFEGFVLILLRACLILSDTSVVRCEPYLPLPRLSQVPITLSTVTAALGQSYRQCIDPASE
jgi:hypothetical protein